MDKMARTNKGNATNKRWKIQRWCKATIDRINSSKQYERGSIRMKSQEENRELADNDKKKSIALMVGGKKGLS